MVPPAAALRHTIPGYTRSIDLTHSLCNRKAWKQIMLPTFNEHLIKLSHKGGALNDPLKSPDP